MKNIFAQYGAGNIGRGFIGPLFARAGYEVRFIDIDKNIIEALNSRKSYTVEIVSNEGTAYETVEGVSGVYGGDPGAAAGAIAQADCMATAVGANILPRIAPVIAEGLRLRLKNGRTDPFNIIICENLMDADQLLRGLIDGYLDEEARGYFHDAVGLVEASIGRMVPVISPEDRAKDPLRVRAEQYCELPVDAEAVKGALPEIQGLHPEAGFGFYIRRKLFLHNMSHALTAYLGSLTGYEHIWEAIGDPYIRLMAQRAMLESAAALSITYGVPMEGIMPHISDLLLRYGNRALGDTAARVGADTYRKLGARDRLAGAASFCGEAGVEPVYICAGLTAAFFFAGGPGDIGTAKILEMVKNSGMDAVLREHGGLAAHEPALGYAARYAGVIKAGKGIPCLLDEAETITREILRRKNVV